LTYLSVYCHDAENKKLHPDKLWWSDSYGKRMIGVDKFANYELTLIRR
jgi:hypothetical protein